MTSPSYALVDTSVFIGLESGREVTSNLLPDRAGMSMSVVTLAELTSGVLAADNTDTRTRRLTTLNGLADMAVLPIDEPVAREWARLRVFLAEQQRRVNVNDLWIAATAVSRGIPLLTQDADFDALEGVRGLEVIRV